MSKTEEAKGPQLPASPVGILPRLMSDAASELFYINIKTSGSQIRKSFHSHTSGSQIHLLLVCLCVCMSGLVDEKELSDEFKKFFCSLGLLLEENKTQVSQRLVLIGTSQIIFE